ncbi:unnamed protein product [Cyprideis torosa]|uniref:COP9 signalosome complex subunit 4 n=1 Tax=Cyprideis torosa TaxID=163714 RepID=A0A7R8WDY9_9CRUS|nr:unnamed protein product [Cyprideis torosa]CAG0888827.1 unnamed protein product [Cyprideis torosa]
MEEHSDSEGNYLEIPTVVEGKTYTTADSEADSLVESPKEEQSLSKKVKLTSYQVPEQLQSTEAEQFPYTKDKPVEETFETEEAQQNKLEDKVEENCEGTTERELEENDSVAEQGQNAERSLSSESGGKIAKKLQTTELERSSPPQDEVESCQLAEKLEVTQAEQSSSSKIEINDHLAREKKQNTESERSPAPEGKLESKLQTVQGKRSSLTEGEVLSPIQSQNAKEGEFSVSQATALPETEIENAASDVEEGLVDSSRRMKKLSVEQKNINVEQVETDKRDVATSFSVIEESVSTMSRTEDYESAAVHDAGKSKEREQAGEEPESVLLTNGDTMETVVQEDEEDDEVIVKVPEEEESSTEPPVLSSPPTLQDVEERDADEPPNLDSIEAQLAALHGEVIEEAAQNSAEESRSSPVLKTISESSADVKFQENVVNKMLSATLEKSGDRDKKPLKIMEKRKEKLIPAIALFQRVHVLVQELQEDVSDFVHDRMKYLIEQVLSDSIPLTVSRQAISGVIDVFTTWSDEPAKAMAQFALDRYSDLVIVRISNLSGNIYEREGEWQKAATALEGIPLENEQKYSVNMKLETYLKIARLYLEHDDPVQAETYVNRASLLQTETKDESLQIYFKVCYARVLDYRRKFIEAAQRYNELGYKSIIAEEERTTALKSALICTVLASAGAPRSRMLATLYRDERCQALGPTLYGILEKMHLDRIIHESELRDFSSMLQPHQKALRADGSTILERAILEHNLLSASKLYANIPLSELSALLHVGPEKAEKVAAEMISEGRLQGKIDQVEQILEFRSASARGLALWTETCSDLCSLVNSVVEKIEQAEPQWMSAYMEQQMST